LTEVGLVSARLLSLVRDGDRLYIGTGAGEPTSLLRSLVEDVLPRRRDVELVQVSIGGSELIATVGRDRGHRVCLVAGGAVGAAAVRSGAAELVPASMGALAQQIRERSLRIDGVLLAGVRARNGRISPGLSLDLGPVAAAVARFRALELNFALPRTRAAEWLKVADCDLVAESDEPPRSTSRGELSAAQRSIGRHVSELIVSGSSIELGVGHGLQGVAQALIAADAPPRISIHTGLIGDDVRDLVEAGIAAAPAPCSDGASVVASVALGSSGFYRWLDENRAVTFVGSAEAHSVAHLLSIGPFMAINSAAEVDVLGQVGARTWSGVLGGGGLPDFAAAGAAGLASVIALESRDARGISKITPRVARVQLHAAFVTHVVTEHGVAQLRSCTPAERAERIISIAHPDDREQLHAMVRDLGD